MKTRKYTYDDPTGGGDDITVEAPVWAELSSTLSVYDTEGERHDFTLSDEAEDEDEEED